MDFDCSLNFSKIREMRKQNKSDYSRISADNDDELLPQPKVAFAGSLGMPYLRRPPPARSRNVPIEPVNYWLRLPLGIYFHVVVTV
ncbi:hypothetical protein KSP40_PGU004061 [Platanthera guangdongensis]|uniref:NADH-plastoquinone oxidoreductase subunit K n=1 Tax=Platanthera guangdongensis TaxID=2320717 RepID=A0ABR2N294_9ASPA